MQREKEKVAAKMREKQAAGMHDSSSSKDLTDVRGLIADAKKATEGAGGAKK